MASSVDASVLQGIEDAYLKDLLGRKYVTLSRLCELLGVTYQTGLRYMKRQYLRGVKTGGSWRIYEEEIRRFLESGNLGQADTVTAKASEHYKKTRPGAIDWHPKSFSTDDLE